MIDYLTRTGKTIIIMIVVVLSVAYVQSLKKGIHKPLEGQTAVMAVELTPTPTRTKVTAYCPCPKCCGKWSDGQTASGYWIQPGDRFVAAPKHIPFGTEIVVPGYNDGEPVKVLDRGGAITNERLDVYFDTHQEALNWGVRYLVVRVVEKN